MLTIELDSTYLKGALRMVPCNDGSMIGGAINCPTFNSNSIISDRCVMPVLTRSWDGGRTWSPENVDAPDYAFGGIVRLRDGVLLTSHNPWVNRFMVSRDNGNSWQPLIDTTDATPTSGPVTVAVSLHRDARGILYWKRGGLIVMSLNNGLTCISLSGSTTREGYHVLTNSGIMVLYEVDAGNSPGAVRVSTNHGRTWINSLQGYSNRDSASRLWGCVVIRDTIAVSDAFGTIERSSSIFTPKHRTSYYHSSSQIWKPGQFLGIFNSLALMDSSETFFHSSGAGIYKLALNDSSISIVARDCPSELVPCNPVPGDTIPYLYGRKGELFYLFYDLDGNIHPQGNEAIFPTTKPRPVSRLDRLYTCSGVEYVIGGRNIESVSLDSAISSNATLRYTITPNHRLATIIVDAADSSLAMYFSVTVSDSELPKQVFTDSVIGVKVKPIVSFRSSFGTTYLECSWLDGPYMWLRNGEPVLGFLQEGISDSVIKNPIPGRYAVQGKSQYGCDVLSNEYLVTATQVENATPGILPSYTLQSTSDGKISIEWPTSTIKPTDFQIYDLLGRRIQCNIEYFQQHAEITALSAYSIVYVVAVNSTGLYSIGGVFIHSAGAGYFR